MDEIAALCLILSFVTFIVSCVLKRKNFPLGFLSILLTVSSILIVLTETSIADNLRLILIVIEFYMMGQSLAWMVGRLD